MVFRRVLPRAVHFAEPLRGVDREPVAVAAPRAGRRPGEGPPVLRLRLVLAEPAPIVLTHA